LDGALEVVAGTVVDVVVSGTVVVVSTTAVVVVGDGSGSSSGQRAQTPTARPTTIRPAASRRITAPANLRPSSAWVKAVDAGREKS
jgi:hypothetical protein